MKLILVAKADLKDLPNHYRTITLGTNFKINYHSQAKTDVKRANHLIKKIILLKRRMNGDIYPTNVYALRVSDDVYNNIEKQIAEKNHPEMLDIKLPVQDYALIGIMQVHKNDELTLILNSDFGNIEWLDEVKNLGNKLNVSGSDLPIAYENLGYCSLANTKSQGFFDNKTDSSSKKHPHANEEHPHKKPR